MADEHYDAIVIGTSQGGRFLPVELAKAGQKVALVERDQLGGVCVNRGCTPTKTLVASARLAYQARRWRSPARATLLCWTQRRSWSWTSSLST
jgi:pyruvate/2-oxoglutarate dehydrogenase complex dihydrolipoamide dehydrogenase (E3) component